MRYLILQIGSDCSHRGITRRDTPAEAGAISAHKDRARQVRRCVILGRKTRMSCQPASQGRCCRGVHPKGLQGWQLMPTILCLLLPLTLPLSLAKCCCQFQTLCSTPLQPRPTESSSPLSSSSPHLPLLPPPPPSWFALITPLYLVFFWPEGK